MKKTIVILVMALFLFSIIGCGETEVINGVEYDTYGLINMSDKKNEDIRYRIIIGNVVWSIILFETIVAPIYFFGFSIYEPVGVVDKDAPKGAI